MPKCLNIKTNKSFTLLEAILAVFVTSVGVLGAYGLSQQILVYSSLSNSNFTAAYLAKEGIEIVRNIRDSNWVQEVDWRNGLIPPTADCTAGCEVDYNDSALSLWTDPGRYLRIEPAGFYNYDSGSNTKYKRKITIEALADGSLRVTSAVFWSEKGQQKSITAQDILYEWWQ